MNKNNNLIFSLLVLLNIGDLITTKIFLNKGGRELNPLFDGILETHFWVGILYKITLMIFVYVVCVILSRKCEQKTSNVLWFLNGLSFSAVLVNTTTILRFLI